MLRCIEDTDQCMLLIKDLQERIRQTFTTEIQNEDVLNQDYIRRVLHLRKVTTKVSFTEIGMNSFTCLSEPSIC